MTPAENYIPVPVSVAEHIANIYKKSIVIILAHDEKHGFLHTTTFGIDPQNKAWAANGGEIATKALGGLVDLRTDYQDYRIEIARKLLTALQTMLDQVDGDARAVQWFDQQLLTNVKQTIADTKLLIKESQ